MLLGMALMFIMETGILAIIAWYAWRRIAAHLKENENGVAALTTHLFLPLLGKRKEGEK